MRNIWGLTRAPSNVVFWSFYYLSQSEKDKKNYRLKGKSCTSCSWYIAAKISLCNSFLLAYEILRLLTWGKSSKMIKKQRYMAASDTNFTTFHDFYKWIICKNELIRKPPPFANYSSPTPCLYICGFLSPREKGYVLQNRRQFNE